MADNHKPQSWWQTLPGILTGAAAAITAVTGLLAILVQQGVIGGKDKSASPSRVEAPSPSGTQRSSNVPASDPTTHLKDSPKAWAETEAIITANDGTATTIRAETLSNCISVDHALDLYKTRISLSGLNWHPLANRSHSRGNRTKQSAS